MASGEPEVHLVGVLCRSDGVAVDVGANRGVYSYCMRPHVRHVYALEANPSLVNFIQRWADAKVTVQHLAASNHIGTANLLIPSLGGNDLDGLSTLSPTQQHYVATSRRIEVPCSTIDALKLHDVGMIKIDVEGHELEVLEGARATIQRYSPSLLIECEERHRPGALQKINEDLSSLGYIGAFIFEGSAYAMNEFDHFTHQNSDSVTFGGKVLGKQYVNNFIFSRDKNILSIINSVMMHATRFR